MVKFLVVIRIVLMILMLYVFFFALPIVIALIQKEYDMISSFAIPGILVFLLGAIVLLLTKRFKQNISLKQGLLVVPLSWFFVSLVGSLPYIFSNTIPEFSNAFFETASGLTTTGASILSEIESLPKSILFWRALTHWIGGMGIVVLTVALFPLIGIGANTLIAAESPGPALEKITPRITSMAKIFWVIYLSLTLLEAALLYGFGMSWFDAITHSFATLATGGFSTYNTSLIEVSAAIKIIITIFMLLAGINFALYFALLTGNLRAIVKDTELKTYLLIVIGAGLIITFNLVNKAGFSIKYALLDGFFQTTAILTTTGFVASDFEMWPYLAQGILFLLMFVGGCAGSTGGGVKVIRIIIMGKYIVNELTHFFIPLKVQRIKINKRPVTESYVKVVLLFLTCYFGLLLLITFVLTLANNDLLTSFTTSLVTLGNIGPGFGGVGALDNYNFFAPLIKIFLSLVMIAGRLELFVVLVIFSPQFWR